MLVLEGLVGLHRFNFSFFSVAARGIDLDYCDTEWFPLETDHSVFEIACKYCILDSSVDYLVMSMCRVFSCVVGRGYLL